MKRCLVLLGIVLSIFFVSGCCTKELVLYKKPAPPPLKVEIRTAPPYKTAVWVPGHWEWKRRQRGYVWVSGHWRRL